MARRNLPSYNISILEILGQRAEARVQRLQQIRELGGLPPQPEVTPQLWDEGYYHRRFPQEGDRTADYATHYGSHQMEINTDEMTQMTIRHLDDQTTRRRMEGMWVDMESLHNDSYMQTFQHFQEFKHEKIYEQLLRTFTLKNVRKNKLAEKETVTNQDARFLLEKNND